MSMKELSMDRIAESYNERDLYNDKGKRYDITTVKYLVTVAECGHFGGGTETFYFAAES